LFTPCLLQDTDGAIKFYSDSLRKFDRYDFPEEWATCHASNAKLFADRSSGSRKNNIENGLYHIENALQVYTSRTHPLPWSDLAMLACNLFRERVSLHEQKTVKKLRTGADEALVDGERALENAEAALTVLTEQHQPIRFARANREIAQCHMKRFEGGAYHVDEQESIEVAIRSAENAMDIFKRMLDVEKKPQNYDKKTKKKVSRTNAPTRRTTTSAAMFTPSLPYSPPCPLLPPLFTHVCGRTRPTR